MLSRDEIAAAAGQLRALVGLVEAGELELRPEPLAHLRGSVLALDELLRADAVRDTDV